ncbi:MAG: SUMF1/EgtB/PvdO family nonheme iron enzyme, partial [Gammaproteobacteria bacterium]
MLLVPDIDWVPVPAGEFIYGEDESQTSLYLEAFEIARYPVTNRQYQCFVDDGGYEDERWWQDLQKPEIRPSDWPQGNRPRVNVDWFEATAFKRWLSARLGYDVRLPYEHEWEKAARGEKGLVYPWGEDYRSGCANVDESSLEDGAYLEQTTAVGLYPRDNSPYEARDMAGNIVEWCNEVAPGRDGVISIGAPPSPVLRGGSWYYLPRLARAALRSG